MTTIEKKPPLVVDLPENGIGRILIGLSWDPEGQEFYSNTATPPPADKPLPVLGKGAVKIFYKIAYFFLNAPHNIKYAAEGMKETIPQIIDQRKGMKADDAPGRDKDFNAFDLDLLCLIFNKDGDLIARVGPDSEEMADETGVVYHSGDNFSGGMGGTDDERIYINSKNLPDSYMHFFFVVLSDSSFTLDEISNPCVRIADGMTERDFLRTPLGETPESKTTGYAFCHLWRQDGKWLLENVDTYSEFETDWPAFFKTKIFRR